MALRSLRSTASMVCSDEVATIGAGGATPSPRKMALKVRRMGVLGGGMIQSSAASRSVSRSGAEVLPVGTAAALEALGRDDPGLGRGWLSADS